MNGQPASRAGSLDHKRPSNSFVTPETAKRLSGVHADSNLDQRSLWHDGSRLALGIRLAWPG
jgi:hypothetical protein